MKRTQFTFYESFSKAISHIHDAVERAAAYDTICDYVFYGKEPGDDLSDTVMIVFELVRPTLDASQRKAENGKAGGRPRKNLEKPKKTYDAFCFSESESEKEEEKEKEVEIEIENKNDYSLSPPYPPQEGETKKTQKQERKKYGHFGWVKLTDTEYARLTTRYGKERLEVAIAHVDEAAQSTGNKNRWKDWNLTIQRCIRDGWDARRLQGMQAPGPTPPVTTDDYDRFFREMNLDNRTGEN